MIVYRVMSDKEYMNWRSYGVKGLFVNDGKTKKMLWFALDIDYVKTILMRKMYNNRLVGEAYTKIVIFDITLKGEVEVKLKPENMFINVGIPVKYMDRLKLKELGYYDVGWFAKMFLMEDVKPLMYYWNREGKGQVVMSKKDVRNLVCNGRLDKRAWFMRADVYEKFRGAIERKIKSG